MAIKKLNKLYSFSFWDCWDLLLGQEVLDHPLQLQKATSSGFTIDDNL
jgi:hypothetical protein